MRVIGVGSPFGADRAGWDAVAALADDPEIHGLARAGRISLHSEDRPGLRLLEQFGRPGLVILVDAMRAGGRPGEVRCFDGRHLPAEGVFTTTHDFGIKAALDLAGELGEVAPEVRVIGIGIADGDTEVSPSFADRFATDRQTMVCDKNVINKIKNLILSYLKEH